MQTLPAATCCPADSCSIATTSLTSLIDAAVATAVANIAAGCTCAVDLVADLIAVTALVNNRVYYVEGYTAVGDGLGGIWVVDTASTETHNGYTVIKPTAITGAGRIIKRL